MSIYYITPIGLTFKITHQLLMLRNLMISISLCLSRTNYLPRRFPTAKVSMYQITLSSFPRSNIKLITHSKFPIVKVHICIRPHPKELCEKSRLV